MARFTRLPPGEVERRRKLSLEAMEVLRREEFERAYQERLDSFYWKHGRCCAGCDHWSSMAGDIGQCHAAPIVSGTDVVRSLGMTFCSYNPAPDHPYTKRDHVCGTFKDEFDWSTLDADYLKRIGAA